MRRGDDGRFGPLVVKELANDDRTMQLQFRPSTGDPDAIDFTLEAERWAVPVGPRVRWNNVRANGTVRDNVLEVSSYALTGFFGITTGTVFAATDVEWVITGTRSQVRSTSSRFCRRSARLGRRRRRRRPRRCRAPQP